MNQQAASGGITSDRKQNRTPCDCVTVLHCIELNGLHTRAMIIEKHSGVRSQAWKAATLSIRVRPDHRAVSSAIPNGWTPAITPSR
jgi:hypothetical protein